MIHMTRRPGTSPSCSSRTTSGRSGPTEAEVVQAAFVQTHLMGRSNNPAEDRRLGDLGAMEIPHSLFDLASFFYSAYRAGN